MKTIELRVCAERMTMNERLNADGLTKNVEQ